MREIWEFDGLRVRFFEVFEVGEHLGMRQFRQFLLPLQCGCIDQRIGGDVKGRAVDGGRMLLLLHGHLQRISIEKDPIMIRFFGPTLRCMPLASRVVQRFAMVP